VFEKSFIDEDPCPWRVILMREGFSRYDLSIGMALHIHN